MRSSSFLLSPPSSPPPAPFPLSVPSSSLTCCPELDLSVTLSPAPKTCHTKIKPRPLKKSHQSDQSELKSWPREQTGRKVCFEEPVVVTVTPEPHMTLSRDSQLQQPVRAQRRSRGRHQAPKQQVPAAASNQDPGCMERVELNTTLALKAELQSLQEAEFNSQKAVQETLQRSERTKNLINTRATEVVNVSRSQLLFTSLVSVDVQEDELISQVLQDRLLLAPPIQCHGNKTVDGPSPVIFMTPDLLRQKPLPPEEETEYAQPRPLHYHAHSTFDLYRQQRCCEATP
ncbi:Protein phosphatase 1 regulatory subunit 35 [Collichthys lucidus]|uniref:Protein phosphatase 1 regulatory subunit 35 n=1 Tax=Collichthys lucidus TaxID=240159 RepID=A0A4U5VIH6_COLLU|nr:Protein phosphatase 1 regulatory subunit 35 [Collichthys lucidus]